MLLNIGIKVLLITLKYKNKITNVLRIDNVVKNSQDLHSVEPSVNGSRKIVSEIQKVIS